MTRTRFHAQIFTIKGKTLSSQGHSQKFVQGGLTFFAPLGPEFPLKSIDFTGPGGLSPHIPPWTLTVL